MTKMIKCVSTRLVKDESGAAMVEYAPLVAMIGTLVVLAGGISTTFNFVITTMGGTTAPIPGNPLTGG